ncbi:MAG: cell division protein ZapB [Nitrospira sp.]|nr:cell division protein ZapB [Candidatus Manganitrophaceae bacterium]HIL34793.1 cell division protein ZapB [Candidatus Manganitrophaceae bacterium]
MELEQLEILESRIQEMVGFVRRLKSEKAQLETRLDQREKEFQALHEERGKVRLRIEALLGKLDHLEKEVCTPDEEALIGE